MGTLNVLGHFAKVLIDSGATHSVISHKFSQITQPHPILIDDVVMSANLVPLDIMPIQIVMGRVHRPGMPTVTFVGEHSGLRHRVITAMKAKRMLGKGYLVHVALAEETTTSVEDVGVVRHFPDVFPDDLPCLPPYRELEFTIDLLPGTNPISLTPYRVAHAELRELKAQLQELVDMRFIQPSISP